jgi:hypothetical protein
VRRELDPPIGAVCRNGARSVNGDQEVSASNGKRRRSAACRQPPGCARRRRKRNRAPEKANVRIWKVMKGNPLERIVSRALMSIEDRNRVLAQCLGRPIRNTREGTKSERGSCLLAFWGLHRGAASPSVCPLRPSRRGDHPPLPSAGGGREADGRDSPTCNRPPHLPLICAAPPLPLYPPPDQMAGQPLVWG